MAIERDSLTVSVQVKTNSKAAAKELAKVEKELQKLAPIVSKNADEFQNLAKIQDDLIREIDQSDSKVQDLSVSLQKLSASMAIKTKDTEKKLAGLTSQVTSLQKALDETDASGTSKQIDSLALSLEAIDSVFSRVSRAVGTLSDVFTTLDLMTSPQFIGRVAGLAAGLSVLFDREGLLLAAKAFDFVSDKLLKFAEVAEAFRERFSLSEILQGVEESAVSFSSAFKDATIESLSSVENFSSNLQGGLGILRGYADSAESVVKALAKLNVELLRTAASKLGSFLIFATGSLNVLVAALISLSVTINQTSEVIKKSIGAYQDLIAAIDNLIETSRKGGSDLVKALGVALDNITLRWLGFKEAIASIGKASTAGAKQISFLSKSILDVGSALRISKGTLVDLVLTMDDLIERLARSALAIRELGLLSVAILDIGSAIGFSNSSLAGFVITLDDLGEAASRATGKAVTSFRSLGSTIADVLGPAPDTLDAVSSALRAMGGIAEDVGGIFGSAFKSFGQTATNLTKSAGDMAVSTAKITSSLIDLPLVLASIPSNPILNLAEALTIASGVLSLFGNALVNMESSTAKFTGAILLLAAAVTDTLLIALRKALSVAGSLTRKLGVELFLVMEDFIKVSEKGALVQKQFAFAVQSFGKALGKEAVGSLSFWNEKIKEIRDSSLFLTRDITKGITNLIKESKILGLTANDSALILERSKEIAAANGAEIEAVTQAVISALTGQSTALLNLGVDLRETTVLHGHLGEEVKGYSEEQRAAAIQTERFAQFLKQTLPLIGSTQIQFGTLSGQVDRLNRAFIETKQVLGEVSPIIVKITDFAVFLLEAVNKMPKPLATAISLFLNWGSILLIVIGTMTEYLLLLSSISLAYGFLSSVLATNAVAQGVVSSAMTVLGTAVGVQTVQVTSLGVAWSNLLLIMKGGLLKVIPSLIEAMKLLTTVALTAVAALTKFLVALLPLVTKVAFLVASIKALVVSTEILAEKVAFVSSVTKNLAKAFSLAGTATADASEKADGFSESLGDKFGNLLMRTFQILVDVATVLSTAFIRAILLAVKVVTKLRKAWVEWTDSTEEGKASVKAMAKELDNLNETLGQLDKIGAESAQDILNLGENFKNGEVAAKLFGESADSAAEKLGNLNKHTKEVDADLKRIAATLTQVSEVNRNLRLDIASIGSNDIDILREKLAFDLKSVDIAESKLEAEKLLSSEVRSQLDVQRQLLSERAGAEMGNIRLQVTESILDKNKELAAQQELQDLKGIAAAQKRLELALSRIDAEIIKQQKEDAGNASALAALKEQKDLINSIGKRDVLALTLDTISKTQVATKQLENQMSLIGLEGEELAERQLELQLEKIDLIKTEQILQGVASQESIAGLEKQKKILAEMSQKRKGAAEDKGGGAGQILTDSFSSMTAGVMDGASVLLDVASQAGQNFGASLTKQSNTLLTGFSRIPDMLLASTENFADTMKGFLERAPQAIIELFNSAPAVIDMIVEAFLNLFDKLPALFDMIVSRIPELITKIMDALPSLIAGFLQALPLMINSLMLAIPDILVAVLQGLPTILSALIEGLIGAMGQIVGGFIDAFITKGGAVKIAGAIVEAVIKSIGAILTGISKGIQKALKGIFGGFEIPAASAEKFTKKLSDGIRKVVTSATGVAEDAFAVIDIPADGGAKKTTEAAKEVAAAFETGGKKVIGAWQAFLNALRKLWDKVTQAWRKLFKFLSKIFERVLKPILMVFVKAISALAEFLMKIISTLGEGIASGIKSLVEGVVSAVSSIGSLFSSIIEGLVEWGQTIFTVFQRVFEFFRSILQATFQVYSNIFNLLKQVPELILEAWSVVFDFFKNVLKGDVNEAFKGVFDFFNKLGDIVSDAFKPLADIIDPQALTKAFAGILDPFKEFFSGENFGKILKKAFEISPIGLLFKVDAIRGIFQKALAFNPVSLLSKMFGLGDGMGNRGTVEKLIGIDVPFVSFADGGTVPGRAKVAGDSLTNDTVLARLSPEEFVIPRSIAMLPGMRGFLEQLLSTGKLPGLALGGSIGKAISDAGSSGGQAIGKALETVGEIVEGISSSFDPSIHLDVVQKQVAKALKAMIQSTPKFENGGPTGNGGLSMTHPGEFVLRDQAVKGIGQSTASFINQTGKLPEGTGSKTVNITFAEGSIQVTGVQDPEQFVDRIFEEIKERSADGQEIMFDAGIRKLA